MVRTSFLISFMLFAIQSLVSQYVVKNAEELNSLMQLPQEKAYVSHTGNTVFSGEYFYYSLYVFNTQFNRLTDLSSVGYITLVNDQKQLVLEQKVKLEKGLGQGQFFVSTDLPSGTYKLLAYTNWMKNNGLAQLYQEDITIINPYRADTFAATNDTAAKKQSTNQVIQNSLIADTTSIAIRMETSDYSTREKVVFEIKNFKGYLGNGHYTIKVLKNDDFFPTSKSTSVSYAKSFLNVDKTIRKRVGDSLFLPEQRGELFYGRLLNSKSKEPVADQTIVVSFPGEEFILKFTTSDQQGNFYTYVRKNYQSPQVIVQTEKTNSDFDISMGELPQLNFNELSFSEFQLNKEAAEAILERSIKNQIENQFYTVKPDSIVKGDPIDPFDGGLPETITLDDYTRFNTLQETLVELLNKAGYRNNGKNEDYIRIAQDFETFDEPYNDYPALVLIDGVYIPDHESIKDFDARKIESISLIRDQFSLGSKNYQGMMVVKTTDGDYFEGYTPVSGINTHIQGVLPQRNYFKQSYKTDAVTVFKRVPDYRRILFWEPALAIDDGLETFFFYTSDVEGSYSIILDGFTTYGKPIHIEKSFRVTSTLH